MPQYKVSATGSTPTNVTTRKGRATAPDVRAVILRLFQRFPQLADVDSLAISVALDDEEDLT
jgi:hypothetical protein